MDSGCNSATYRADLEKHWSEKTSSQWQSHINSIHGHPFCVRKQVTLGKNVYRFLYHPISIRKHPLWKKHWTIEEAKWFMYLVLASIINNHASLAWWAPKWSGHSGKTETTVQWVQWHGLLLTKAELITATSEYLTCQQTPTLSLLHGTIPWIIQLVSSLHCSISTLVWPTEKELSEHGFIFEALRTLDITALQWLTECCPIHRHGIRQQSI